MTPKRGPKGQPKGTITTSPKEVDEIIKEVYSKIYKGNAVDKEEHAENISISTLTLRT